METNDYTTGMKVQFPNGEIAKVVAVMGETEDERELVVQFADGSELSVDPLDVKVLR